MRMSTDKTIKDVWLAFFEELYDMAAYTQAVNFYCSVGIEQYLPARTDFLRKELVSASGTDELVARLDEALMLSFGLGIDEWMNQIREMRSDGFSDFLVYEALEDYLFIRTNDLAVEKFKENFLPGAYLSEDMNNL